MLANKVLHACPVPSFADLHHARIDAAENVRVLLHGRALALLPNASGDRVEALHASGMDGRRLRIEAGTFVLAAGGVENPRLLLIRPPDTPRLANDGDLVGRFFMEHWHVDIPFTHSDSDELTFYDEHQPVGDARVWGQLAISEDLQRRERLPGLSLWFHPLQTDAPDAGAIERALALTREHARAGKLYANLKLALRDPRDAAAHLAGRIAGKARPRSHHYFMRVQLEQTPHPENRILPSPQANGAHLVLRLGEDERRAHLKSLRIATEILGWNGRRFARRLALRLDTGRAGFFSHHSGATRMSADPASGVVDADCRVHGVPNLFVCGSSVFPTIGIAPPTLTIVALALRLADRLRGDRVARPR